MKLSIYDVMAIKSALMRMADDKRSLAESVSADRLRDNLLKESARIDEIASMFSVAMDRLFESGLTSIHDKVEIHF